MKNKLLLLLTVVFLTVACKKDETTVLPRLKNCETRYLNFQNDPRYFNRSDISFDISLDGSPGIQFTYKNGRVIKSTGGIIMMGFGQLWVTTSVYDSLVYSGNKVLVYSKPFSPYLVTQTEDPDKPTIYEYDKNNRLTAIIRRDQSAVNYSYQDDMITEVSTVNGNVRNFYFENGNLIKITAKTVSSGHSYYHLKEIFLQDYDDNPNPLKGLFHLPGTFFRAFSDNNYSKISIKDYSSTDNINFELYNDSNYWITLTYNEAGYPMFGEYE
jgi:YD repeat-containing protein